MKKGFKLFSKSKAQTATELAIFGAVLIFVLGTMIRYSLNSNYTQTQTLKAMRLAMQQSFLTSEQGFASRNTATIFFIEDRTTADSDKFGSIHRSPFIASVSASFSKNLYLPVDYPHDCIADPFHECCGPNPPLDRCASYEDLPIMDMFINGQHFQFTTAGFREYDLLNGGCPLNSDGTVDTECERMQAITNYPGDIDNACSPGGPCRLLFLTSPNLAANTLWHPTCANQVPLWGRCFDVYRNGARDASPLAADFSWQWYRFRGTSANINLQEGKNTVADVDGDLREEAILEMIDVDGYRYTPLRDRDIKRAVPIAIVRVLDYQAGDIDLTWAPITESRGLDPGLKDDSQLYEFIQDGTYLSTEEGKLTGGNQVARSVQKKDMVVVIERMVQLSNDTGWFCGNGSGARFDAARGVPNVAKNPGVEVCVQGDDANCFDGEVAFQTCFNETSKKLFVRSRLSDKRGRKWITDLGARGY